MYIYKVTNLINNKIYIGKKSKSAKSTEAYFGSGKLISYAIEKYGVDNFRKDILEDEISNISELNEREKYWISFFSSTDKTKGYNLTLGGDGGDTYSNKSDEDKESWSKAASKGQKSRTDRKPLSEETKLKISNSKKGQIPINKGTKWSDEERKKISEKTKEFFKNNPDVIKKMSDSRKGKPPSNKGSKMSNESKLKVSESLKEYYKTNTVWNKKDKAND